MIPYEDLVIALQTWRAKQGLPVGQLSGALTPPMEVAPPDDARPRTAPPVAPPRAAVEAFLGGVATPPPLEPVEESLEDVDAGALIEEQQYEHQGDDFAMAFGNMVQQDEAGDSTMIGDAPERPTETSLDQDPAAGSPPTATTTGE